MVFEPLPADDNDGIPAPGPAPVGPTAAGPAASELEFTYDPTYYNLEGDERAAQTYEVTLDIGSSALGLVMAPMIQQNEKATIVKSFSKRLDGSKGAAEKCGEIAPFDLLLKVDGEDVTDMAYEDCIKLLKKTIGKPRDASGGRQITMTLFRRSAVMKNLREASLAFFKDALAQQRRASFQAGGGLQKKLRWTDLCWVDRYIVRHHVVYDTPQEDRKSVMRRYMLLWHPDRFVAKYGALFADGDARFLAERVQWVSQELSLSKAEMAEDEERQAEKLRKAHEEAAAKEAKEGAGGGGGGGGATGGPPVPGMPPPRRRRDTVREQMSGFLLKEAISSANKNWRRRYFVLDNRANLHYYANQQDASRGKWKGRLELTDESCAIMRDDIRPNCMEISTRDVVLYAAAESEEQRNAWMSAFRSTIEFCTEGKPKTNPSAPGDKKEEKEDGGGGSSFLKTAHLPEGKKKKFSIKPSARTVTFMGLSGKKKPVDPSAGRGAGSSSSRKITHQQGGSGSVLVPPKAMRSRRLVTLEGWAHKQGEGIIGGKRMARRYFALWNDVVLYYFESYEAFEAFFEGDLSVNSAKGSIDLRSVEDVAVSQRRDLGKDVGNGLELVTARRTWLICPEETGAGKNKRFQGTQNAFVTWLSTLSKPRGSSRKAGVAGDAGGGGAAASAAAAPAAITTLVLVPDAGMRELSSVSLHGWAHMCRQGKGRVLDRLYFALWNDNTLFYFQSEQAYELFFAGNQSTDDVLGQIDLDGINKVAASSERDLPFTGINLATAFGAWVVCPEPPGGLDDGGNTFLEWLTEISCAVKGM
eukprot:g1263.t1